MEESRSLRGSCDRHQGFLSRVGQSDFTIQRVWWLGMFEFDLLFHLTFGHPWNDESFLIHGCISLQLSAGFGVE